MTKLTLNSDEAHVWYAWISNCDTCALREYYYSLLNVDERVRLESFALERLKLEYLVTRALCRTVLSAYSGISPESWRFRINEYGRPEIGEEMLSRSLRFNLSNARTLVACVITRGADAGVDVEELNRRIEALSIAGRFFSAKELQELRAIPAENQPRRFFEFWTLKESYIKARGMGFAIPLDQFSFILSGSSIDIEFDPHLGDTAADWQFKLYAPGDYHLMAVSLRRRRGKDFRISVREVVPSAQLIWKIAPWAQEGFCGRCASTVV